MTWKDVLGYIIPRVVTAVAGLDLGKLPGGTILRKIVFGWVSSFPGPPESSNIQTC